MTYILKKCDKQSDGCIKIWNKYGKTIGFVDATTSSSSSKLISNFTIADSTIGSVDVYKTALKINIVEADTLKFIQKLDLSQSNIVVQSRDFYRPSILRGYKFSFILPFVLFFIIAILAFVFSSKIKSQTMEEYCQERHLSGQECANELSLGGPSYGKANTLIAIGVFCMMICMFFLVCFFLTFQFVRYSTCSKRKYFGTTWKWVKPRSGIRKFLCSVFGVCECAADGLDNDCDVTSMVDYDAEETWDAVAAAQSSSQTNTCFCCDPKDNCVNVKLTYGEKISCKK